MQGEAATPEPQRFGTYQGVFRPTFLTILGALLYLREGWLVGNSGLIGALLVLLAATTITGTTALSASSIATNQRVRPGGAFAIISQALGLEAGGAIGGPLFIAQALSASMYAFAFAEVFEDSWAALGGSPVPLVPVALSAFVVVAVLSWRSAALAFRAQAVLLYLVVAALVSLFAGVFFTDLQVPTLLPTTPEVGLVEAFAIFFPALTGIMVGVGMSGQLSEPSRSIPRGTIAAWIVTTALYVVAAVWYSVVATPEELLSTKTLAFDYAAVGWVVRVGLLTSTLTAALSSLVASSRLLQAMAENGVVPRGAWLAALSEDGEPRRATLFTAGIAALGLLSGSLDAIAPIITAFFVLTYLALNSVVLLEQRLGMISFRPTFAVPSWVPLLGVISCSAALFLASPRLILLLGLASVALIYLSLGQRRLDTPWETVRSGIDVAIATWAARRATIHGRTERAWKPDLLAPITALDQAATIRPLLQAAAARYGSVKLVAVGNDQRLTEEVEELRVKLVHRGVFATATSLSATGFSLAFSTALDAMQGDLFPPNLVVLDVTRFDEEVLRETRVHCEQLRLGLALFVPHPQGGLGQSRSVDVWLSDRSPDWTLGLHTTNLDLPVLIGLIVANAWEGQLTLNTALRQGGRAEALRFLAAVTRASRLPPGTAVHVDEGSFLDCLTRRETADLTLLGMPLEIHRDQLLAIAVATGGACLFLMDSGRESALA